MARDWNPDMANWAMYTPWPFSDLFQELGDKVEVFDFEKYNFVTPIMKPDAMDRAELLDRVMHNYRRFFMNKTLLPVPLERDKERRKYLLGCLKAFAKSGFQRTFYDLGRVGYWGPQSKKKVDFGFADRARARPARRRGHRRRRRELGDDARAEDRDAAQEGRGDSPRRPRSRLRRRHRAAREEDERTPACAGCPLGAAQRRQSRSARSAGSARSRGCANERRAAGERHAARAASGRTRSSASPMRCPLHRQRATRALFERAGLALPARAARADGRRGRGARCCTANCGARWAEVAAEVARSAGRRTADYLLAHRIPKPVQALLKALPARLAARVLLSAIARHAWTFAGSGVFSASTGARARPSCWRSATTRCAGASSARRRPATSTPPPSSACSRCWCIPRPRRRGGLRGLRRRRLPLRGALVART
jgi:hypothetical protein